MIVAIIVVVVVIIIIIILILILILVMMVVVVVRVRVRVFVHFCRIALMLDVQFTRATRVGHQVTGSILKLLPSIWTTKDTYFSA